MSVLCACGCGKPVTYDRARPRRFIVGHNGRREIVTDYRKLRVGMTEERLHRVRAERALGHPLPAGAEVHHADGSKSETSPLVICQDRAYHMLLHRRMRIRAAGGDPNTDKICWRCHQVKPQTEFHTNRSAVDGLSGQCRPCGREHSLATRARRREVEAR